ncbi:MAG TPA: hypothetical protein PKV16_00900 [Caldisericia bacterium]|nr:hypothetical protein [Caldisericia bacterium]HPF49030.1 hypothetical protein [Caldisericia bacterium]HPI83106.1 hypothetical protein [Caldisericia bacterium]HPQ92333.1 hypothetical protein [Caldisericia bacterium]HRV74569.1 hypothetical protein [Caldisericia bacterium]
MQVDGLLQDIRDDMTGFECAAVVGTDGLVISQNILSSEVDIFAMTVEFASIYNQTRKAVAEIDCGDNLSAIFSLEKHSIVLSGIEGTNFFVLLCLDVSSGNIGKAKYLLSKMEDKFKDALR